MGQCCAVHAERLLLRNTEHSQLIDAVVAKDGLPMYTVEKPGVHQIKSLDPRYQLPGRKYFS